MKSRGYCGGDSHDAAPYRSECGSNERKQLPPPKPTALEPVFKRGGPITSIQCRTLGEAALVAKQLEKADILALVPEEPFEKYAQYCVLDISVPVQVSSGALDADQELSESLGFRADTLIPHESLPWGLKITALCLPVVLPAGLLLFIAGLGRFRSRGFARKVRDWKRWSLLGLVGWTAILLILIRLVT